MSKHFVVPDSQAKPGQDLSYLRAIGMEIVEQRPDVIIHLGDNWDLPSLSSYDSARKCEGRRLNEDLQVGEMAMLELLGPLRALQEQQRVNKKKIYKPRLVFLMGNHENRLQRHIDAHPQLENLVTPIQQCVKRLGWECHEFLVPVIIDGVAYAHYFYAPNTGRPYGGMCVTKLKNIGHSFTMGHVQGLDYGQLVRPDGTLHMGLVVGSSYIEDEEYKGAQANHHWRGVVVKNNVKDGEYDPCFMSTVSLMEKYLGEEAARPWKRVKRSS